jgi:hypothetical protein
MSKVSNRKEQSFEIVSQKKTRVTPYQENQ